MNHKDEELQAQFERGDFPGEGIDVQAYQKVFDALKHEPDYDLPVCFADRLITLVESKEKAKENSRDNFWLGLGLLSFVIALMVAFALTNVRLSAGAFRFLAGYRGLIIFGIAFIAMLNWADRKINGKIETF